MFSFTQIRVIDQHAGIVHNGPIVVCEKVGSKVNVLQLRVHITCVRLKSGAAQMISVWHQSIPRERYESNRLYGTLMSNTDWSAHANKAKT